jgi:hypothetical protein
MLRTLLAIVMAAAPLAAAAGPPATATPGSGPAAETRSRDGGIIEGRITGIDFQRSTLNVDSPARGRVVVAVMPSTSIQTKDAGYHAIADLRVGERVEIYSSYSGGRFIAQIIRVR